MKRLEIRLPTTQEVRDLTACPQCNATQGHPCINERMVQHGNRGRSESNHKERIKEARRLMRELRDDG